MTNNKMFKIPNTNYCLETHDQSQQSKTFCFPLRVSTVFFLTIYFSRTKSLNLAGIFIVRFGLLCGSVVSEVVTDKGEITGLVSASALQGFSGSSGVL